MPTIKHTGGPSPFNHAALSGVSRHGDKHEVSQEASEHLCDTRGYFERTGEVPLSEDEYSVENADADESDGDAIDPADYTVEELREAIDGADDEVLDEIEAAERDGKNRETALEAIDAEREE